MALVTALANQKGGVGKTTLTVNLAAVTAEVLGGDPNHSPVLIVSTDRQASADWWASQVKDLPFEIRRVDDPTDIARLAQLPEFQHIFVDTPGSLDDTATLQAVLDNSDQVIVPMPPEPLAFDPTARTIEHVLKPRGIPFVVVVNLWDPRDGEINRDETFEYIDRRGWPRTRTAIRKYRVHAVAAAAGRVVTQYQSNKIELQARQDFDRLALELAIGRPTQQKAVS